MKSCGIRLVLLILFFSSQLLFSASAAPARPVGQSTRHAPAALISQGLAFAGHLGGTPGAIATQGAYVYAGLGRELAIIDVANPAAPMRVGYIMLPSLIQKVVVAGSYLYIAADDLYLAAGGLYVLDVADPIAPADSMHSWSAGWRPMPVRSTRSISQIR